MRLSRLRQRSMTNENLYFVLELIADWPRSFAHASRGPIPGHPERVASTAIARLAVHFPT
jgi:hypothetical protein